MDDGPTFATPRATKGAQRPALDLLSQRLTDTGNAARFVAAVGQDFRHVHPWGWMSWRGNRWAQDTLGQSVEACKDVVDRAAAQVRVKFAIELRLPQRDPLRAFPDELLRHFRQSESVGKLKAMRELAQSDPAVAETVEAFDAKPYLVNTKTKTIDLKTGKSWPARREDLLTVAAAHDPADEPFHESDWALFLQTILPDAETRAYVQRAIGCSLIGEQRDHVVFLAYGSGGNGKGTLFRAIDNAVGAYYTTIPASMLIDRPQQAHAAQVADLMGKRLVVSSEIGKGQKFDEAKVKELSGGDRIKAQFMRQDWFSFKPTHTLWICCNDKPRITGTDKGIWRRMRLIPFTAQISAEQEDHDLDSKLLANAGIILQWCIDGAIAYMRDGLGACPEVAAATAEYRADEDMMGLALSEIGEFGPDKRCARLDMRDALTAWYRAAGMAFIPIDKTIKTDFITRGIVPHRLTDSTPWDWRGIDLRPEVLAEVREARERKERQKRHAESWHDRG